MAYKEWRNTLYEAGYAGSLVHKEEQRLLTLGELEAVCLFFWESVFSESSRGRIPIEMALGKLSLNHRICMELAPWTIYPWSLQFGSSKRKPGNQDVLTTKPTGLTKAERKKLKTEQEKMGTRVKVIADGVEKLLPPRKFGYTSDGKKSPTQTLLGKD